MDPTSTKRPTGPLCCIRCEDEIGPLTLDGLCEDCERLVPAEND